MTFRNLEKTAGQDVTEQAPLSKELAPVTEGTPGTRLEKAWDKALNALDSLDLPKLEKAETESLEKDLEALRSKLNSSKALRELMDKHPEKQSIWDSFRDCIDTLQDPDASPAEIKDAKNYIDRHVKSTILELAVKDLFTDLGFDVPNKQVQTDTETENKDTRIDVLGTNNTNKPIQVFGVTLEPGEQISAECKCGCKIYISNELRYHLPDQLSGHQGRSILLTTSDIEQIAPEKVDSVCRPNNTTLVNLGLFEADIVNALKEVDRT